MMERMQLQQLQGNTSFISNVFTQHR